MKYNVVDDLLPHDVFLSIRNHIMGYDFPWFYQDDVTGSEKGNLSSFYFTHQFVYETTMNSSYYSIISPLVSKINHSKIIRIKSNFYPNLGREIENEWHSDYDYSHKGAIFYINDNNGYTILEDGTKIESRANRILFFDPSIKHKSTHCTDAKSRVNINFNYF
jgi:hypothetical protein